jgi:outer membrane receptor for monomeric catechols
VYSASRTTTTSAAYHTMDLSPYLQDDIKVNQRLTLNAGLRWDIMVPYVLSQNQNVFLNESALNLAAGSWCSYSIRKLHGLRRV